MAPGVVLLNICELLLSLSLFHFARIAFSFFLIHSLLFKVFKGHLLQTVTLGVPQHIEPGPHS